MIYETSKTSIPIKNEPDMSPAAITARLRLASDLTDLCLSLRNAPLKQNSSSPNLDSHTTK